MSCFWEECDAKKVDGRKAVVGFIASNKLSSAIHSKGKLQLMSILAETIFEFAFKATLS